MAELNRHLVLGGARSGKTAHALHLARAASNSRQQAVSYVATAQALDQEMQLRISRHRAERPSTWQTVESPLQLGASLKLLDADRIVIVDCMTLWLSNAMLVDFDERQPRAALATLEREKAALFEYLHGCRACLILVSNEVGGGIVPLSPLARRFQDEQGALNQALASVCERVTLVVAGLELELKPQQPAEI